jgi:hypothetical protein
MIVKLVHYHLVIDFNIDASLWHILPNLEETGSALFLQKQGESGKSISNLLFCFVQYWWFSLVDSTECFLSGGIVILPCQHDH